MSDNKPKQIEFWGNDMVTRNTKEQKKTSATKTVKQAALLPEKLGKAIKLPVPDFSDPNRKLTCLEVDFPIAKINALSNLEGNAGKPIYQMSKWWARRRSSVFRSMLIAAATEAPDDPNEASKRVWDHYYCNHQKSGSFKKLRVLDCFMGGGTTLVEGSRLGMQMTGVDLNPVAWFVVKNELACSDPEQVKALFGYIEMQIKPQIQPFYTTTCPRGHKGRWIDVQSGEKAEIEPMELPPEQRSRYLWKGPEVIYTFWAKHGPCQAKGCGHRTPIFRTPVIADKNLCADFIEFTCPKCATKFHAELGETRMAPGAERIVIEDDIPFTELGQVFAKLLNDYDKGTAKETGERCLKLKEMVIAEKGLNCPECATFSGKKLAEVFEHHSRPSTKPAERKKAAFKILKKKVQMYLLIHPKWLRGGTGFQPVKDNRELVQEGHVNSAFALNHGRDAHATSELGGWAGATAKATAEWFEKRLANLSIVEVRSKLLPDVVTIADGTIIETSQGTVPRQAHFTCAACGREGNTLESVRPTGHTAPVSAYTLQCHCPQCDDEGYTYGGRYFKAPDKYDIERFNAAEEEWVRRADADLAKYWPRQVCWDAYMMRANGGVNDGWGYTHWWKMFNPRQLLVHTQILKAITEAPEGVWPLDVREQALGAFQQYLRNQNMFCFWDISRDCMAPHMSNANYHPKNLIIENCVFNPLGRGNWQSSNTNVLSGIEWVKTPWELIVLDGCNIKSEKGFPEDPIIAGNETYCGSSIDLSKWLGHPAQDSRAGSPCNLFDLVITDPPFGNNLFYADLADFFYVWLRIPLRKWYAGLPEEAYFEPERTPHSMEAVDNTVEHPDDRADYEKDPLIKLKHLARIRERTKDESLAGKDLNPCFRPQPSSDF